MLETAPCTRRSEVHSGSVLFLRGLRLWAAVVFTLALVAGAADASAPSTSRTAVGEIAFSVHHGDGDAPWDIYIVRTDGRWVVKKTTSRLDEDDPVWSPNGRHIAFEGWTIAGGADMWIYTMDPDGTHRRRLAPGRRPQWSPDARRIAYDASDGVNVMNVDGTGKKHVARGGGPRWSRDGKHIAVTRAGDVYIVNASGGGERRLTQTGDNGVEAWAPGRNIVFSHSAINGRGPASGTYFINADGTGLRRIERTSDYATPSIGGWSSDGKLVVYVAAHGISTWRVSDGSIRRLGRSSDDGDPTWGPGGREIAFTRNVLATTRGNGIWIVNRNGSGARRIAAADNPYPHQEPNEYFTPTWATR
jgi:Tol biopolymer transport system component